MASLHLFRPQANDTAPEADAALPGDFHALFTTLISHEYGYDFGPPDGIDPEALAVDVQAAAQMPCEACGWTGGAFAPFHQGDEYRAFCVCCCCGAATEL
jgi:hypothetical protein